MFGNELKGHFLAELQIVQEQFNGGFSAQDIFALGIGVSEIGKEDDGSGLVERAWERGPLDDKLGDERRRLVLEAVLEVAFWPGIAPGDAVDAFFLEAEGAGDVAGAEPSAYV